MTHRCNTNRTVFDAEGPTGWHHAFMCATPASTKKKPGFAAQASAPGTGSIPMRFLNEVGLSAEDIAGAA